MKKNTGHQVKECDLYEPVKKYFSEKGYVVHSEVKNCDVTAVKEDELVIVELKVGFGLKLLYQAMARQKMTPYVYVAIPRPKKTRTKTYLDMLAIVRKLDLGLITVAVDSPVKGVDLVVEPVAAYEKKSKVGQRKKNAVLKEMQGRTFDANTGGSTRVKLVTAYRERSLRIACVMEKIGGVSAKTLVREFGCEKDTYSILFHNPYGWFCKTARGIYDLTDLGREALLEDVFLPVVSHYRSLLAEGNK